MRPATARGFWRSRKNPAPTRDAVEDWDDRGRATVAPRAGLRLDARSGARLRRPRDEEPPDELERDDRGAGLGDTPLRPRAGSRRPPPVSGSRRSASSSRASRRQREDVYGGHAPDRSWNLRPLWDWTKRIVTTGALVAALVYAVLERDVWFPRTAELGQTVFTQIDRQVLAQARPKSSASRSRRPPRSCPSWRRRRSCSSSRAARRASWRRARRSRPRARPRTAAWARSRPRRRTSCGRCRASCSATLSRTEAERVREYDRTRSRRVIFPFENPHVMELVARGARGAAARAPRAAAGAFAQGRRRGARPPAAASTGAAAATREARQRCQSARSTRAGSSRLARRAGP